MTSGTTGGWRLPESAGALGQGQTGPAGLPEQGGRALHRQLARKGRGRIVGSVSGDQAAIEGALVAPAAARLRLQLIPQLLVKAAGPRLEALCPQG